MTDIVRIFEIYSQNVGYIYHYGRKHVLNLLEQGSYWSADNIQVYFLHEFRRGIRVDNNKMKYDGTFYLVKHSTLNQNFFQEVGESQNGKYNLNIEPLIQGYKDIWNHFYCTQMEILSTNFVDITDLLDANLDGIKVDYSVQYINSYNGIN